MAKKKKLSDRQNDELTKVPGEYYWDFLKGMALPLPIVWKDPSPYLENVLKIQKISEEYMKNIDHLLTLANCQILSNVSPKELLIRTKTDKTFTVAVAAGDKIEMTLEKLLTILEAVRNYE